MKKFLLLIFFMPACYAFSQTAGYIPFPGNYIQNSYEWYQPDGCCSTYTHTRSETFGDTVLGSYTYKKYYKTNPSTQLMGAIRNDIPAKKVYYYDFSNEMESLLFNFDLSVGDTVYTSEEDTVFVSDIDSVLLLDGVYHNRYKLLNTAPPCLCPALIPSSLVEGLGYFDGNVYLNEHHTGNSQSQFKRVCAVADGVTLVDNGSPTPGLIGECNSIIGIEESGRDEVFLIYPTPAKDLLHLKLNYSNLTSYNITDLLGKVIFSGSITSSETTIDLTSLPKGTYFIRLIDPKGSCVTKKIIKQ
ncbi:MAG TPA: T9SS type A sorting domain-containing protein [Bacteroidia bacterium]|jgi:hypothetical protein